MKERVCPICGARIRIDGKNIHIIRANLKLCDECRKWIEENTR